MDTQHPTDDMLAQWLDQGSGPPPWQTHVDECATCAQRMEHMRSTVDQVRTSVALSTSVAQQVMERLDAPAHSPVVWWAPLTACVMAGLVALVVPWNSLVNTDPVARGGSPGITPVHLNTHQVTDSKPRLLQPGAELSLASPISLSVSLDLLPRDQPMFAAVYARDASGAITWLFPVYTDAVTHPTCMSLPAGATVLTAPQGVTLDHVTQGPLEVNLLLSEGPCRIVDVDERLESGKEPGEGLRVVERQLFMVR